MLPFTEGPGPKNGEGSLPIFVEFFTRLNKNKEFKQAKAVIAQSGHRELITLKLYQ